MGRGRTSAGRGHQDSQAVVYRAVEEFERGGILMSKARILVVDDDTDIVRLVQGYLRKAGFEVLGAYDG